MSRDYLLFTTLVLVAVSPSCAVNPRARPFRSIKATKGEIFLVKKLLMLIRAVAALIVKHYGATVCN